MVDRRTVRRRKAAKGQFRPKPKVKSQINSPRAQAAAAAAAKGAPGKTRTPATRPASKGGKVKAAAYAAQYSEGFTDVGPYRRRLSVKLDASGNGQVQFDVRSSNQQYRIDTVVVSTNQASTSSPYPTATLYENNVQAGMSNGASWTGNQDTFGGEFIIDAGTDLIVAFTGGITGSIATAVITGRNELESSLAENYGYV